MFRDRKRRVGALDPHCAHRGTSLEWGRVEEEGLRCRYQGWLYDTAGQCTDMPCETEEFRKAMDVRQPAYPATEYGGLVFVYIGPPDTEPLFPASTSSTRSGSASPTISKRRRAAPDRDPRARKPGAFGYRYRDAAAVVVRAAKACRARPRPDQHHARPVGKQAHSDRRLEQDPVAGRSRRPALQRRPLNACPLPSARAGEDRGGVTASMAVDADACIAYNAGIGGKNWNGNADYPQC